MAYLDVTPTMTALRTMPEDFEIRSGWLHHIPSRHSFRFDPNGQVQLRAQCNCSQLRIRPEQVQLLTACFERWQAEYWRPLQINKEFASHFRPRSALRQMLIDLTAWLHQRLLRHDPRQMHLGAMYPAE